MGTEHYEVASPRQGRSALAGARKRQATVDTARTLSAPLAISDTLAGQMPSPGPDVTMEELRSFVVTMFAQNDKTIMDIVKKARSDDKVAITVNDRLLKLEARQMAFEPWAQSVDVIMAEIPAQAKEYDDRVA